MTGAASRSAALVPSHSAWIWASPLLAALVAASTCAQAAEADLARARQLLGEGSDQQAYEVLRPLQATAGADGELTLLLGEAALRTGRAEEAKALFERALALQPDSVGAHQGLGRAYLAMGDYAQAKIEFETVLRFRASSCGGSSMKPSPEGERPSLLLRALIVLTLLLVAYLLLTRPPGPVPPEPPWPPSPSAPAS